MESVEAPQKTYVDCIVKPSTSSGESLHGDNDTTNSGAPPISPPRRRFLPKNASGDVRRNNRIGNIISYGSIYRRAVLFEGDIFDEDMFDEERRASITWDTFEEHRASPTCRGSRILSSNEDTTDVIFEEQHEVMECQPGEDEGSLATYLTTCIKNPDHTGFIPFKDFSVEHITITNSIDELYNMIKFTADLTVRIAVTYTSPKRPDTNVPCLHLRGTRCLRTGTGMITGISKYQEEDGNTCQCNVCKKSENPQQTWWSVGVMTATHVVFDDSEAESATCRLFFDQSDSPVVKLDGWRMWDMSIKGDTCRFSCVSHDMELYEKVQKMYNSYLYCPHKFEEGVSFIVSHPHGCSKQVSIGKYEKQHIQKPQQWYRCTKYTYEMCTCAGSSGAYVFSSDTLLVPHVHSGCKEKINCSGEGYQQVYL